LFLLLTQNLAQGQEPDDGLGEYADAFQDCFFEALKQSNIENYSRALTLLYQCEELNKNESVLYFEMGKNHLKLKNLDEAEKAFLKAQEMQPDNIWYNEALFDFYKMSENLTKSITYSEKLLALGRDYHETLIRLYLQAENPEKASETLNAMRLKKGDSEQVTVLQELIDRLNRQKSRFDTSAFNDVAYQKNVEDLMREEKWDEYQKITADWLQNAPSETAKMYALPFFISQNDSLTAKQVFPSVLKLDIQNNPVLEKLIVKTLAEATTQPLNLGSDPELRTFLTAKVLPTSILTAGLKYVLKLRKNNLALALSDKILEADATNFDGISAKVTLLNRQQSHALALDLSQQALGLYPAQPVFYLESGKALIALNKPDSAVEMLLDGIDFIFDDNLLQNEFYQKLASAYKLLGNTEREAFYRAKLKNIPNP
jgi:predicted Zn-dependent protease